MHLEKSGILITAQLIINLAIIHISYFVMLSDVNQVCACANVTMAGLSTNAGTVLSTIGSLEHNEHNGLNM